MRSKRRLNMEILSILYLRCRGGAGQVAVDNQDTAFNSLFEMHSAYGGEVPRGVAHHFQFSI